MILWYPNAIRRPGPWAKQYSAANAVAGVVCHSMVGSLTAAWSALDDPNREASWTFSVAKDGRVYQSYAINASTWHAGSPAWNKRLVGIEHEGGPLSNPSEPLTAVQRAASVALVRWIAEQGGWEPSRIHPKTLYEHREVAATQCPSGRIPWAAYLPEPVVPVLSPKWDMTQMVRVYRATDSGRAVVTELPEAGGFHHWTVTIPRNAP